MFEYNDRARQMEALREQWESDARWRGIERAYEPEDVVRLRASLQVEHTVARHGAERLWNLITRPDGVRTFGALTGSQAVQMVRAGLEAIYVSGWQVAADANLSGETYPDQSLYPSNSVPMLVRRLSRALLRADQIEQVEAVDGGANGSAGPHDWLVPIVADAEAGSGGPIHAFELCKSLIEVGAAGVHFEDQLAAEKKCGHLGGKVLVPTSQFVRTLNAARLAADVMGVPTVLIARTDAMSARLLTNDVDERDRGQLLGERTSEGYHRVRGGLDAAIARSLAYAPYADVLWFETSTPDIEDAARFAEAIHTEHPGKLLAYNCSPSFNWRLHLEPDEIAGFQQRLAAMGYRFQFVTLAGWHLVNLTSFELASAYGRSGMSAYVEIQEREFAEEANGYTASRHQRESGAGYFDHVLKAASGGSASTTALDGSTESEQFSRDRAATDGPSSEARAAQA